MPGVAFPPVGSLGLGSPPSSVLCSAKTALYPSRVASRALASQYLVCFLSLCSLRLVHGRKLAINARALGLPVPLLFRQCGQGDRWLSHVPEFPLWRHAPLSADPGGVLPGSPLRQQDCCLPLAPECRLSPRLQRGLSGGPRLYSFRGSMTQPVVSLPPAPYHPLRSSTRVRYWAAG